MSYKANVNHYSPECFKYFGEKKEMLRWVSDQIGERIKTIKAARNWQAGRDYVDVVKFADIRQYFAHRRDYVLAVRKCQDLLEKAQRTKNMGRRAAMMEAFHEMYDYANELCYTHPEVWQGEI